MADATGDAGDGVNAAELGRREKDALAGTGGSSGGGTRAGPGSPSGGTTDRDSDVASGASGDAGDAIGEDRLAAARNNPATGGEALAARAGRATGSGTPADKGDLGGGGSAA